jgi:hypothetical protein
VANGTRLGTELGIFHDCPTGAVSLQQVPNATDGAISAHCARLEVTDFEGSFLSLAIDLPAASLRDLRTMHVIRVDGSLQADVPVKTFVRLNIRHGINIEQRLRAIPAEAGRFTAAFDFIDGSFDVEHAEKAWIDIIFGQPRRSAITIGDLHLSRFRRAEI